MPLKDAQDAAHWLRLSLIPGLGSATICQLLAKFGTPDHVLNASTHQLREVVDTEMAYAIQQGASEQAVAQALEWLKKDHTHLVTLADETYPKQLLEINSPPAILYGLGNIQLLNQPCIAVVGSRNPTPQGEKNAEDFAENLCQHGLCVVSGMALGIDGAAHRGALKASGTTIAVVGTGLDIVYPSRHRDLAHQISQRGLILSEFPLGTPSKAQNFPRRNRIISGLSLGCLVVEANIDSGSLITARLAAEQGREVFAIPGSIHSPVAKGCHQLIKQGAKLVESAQDILDELPTAILANTTLSSSPLGSDPVEPIASHNDSETARIMQSMGYDAVSFEILLTKTGLTSQALSSMLMLLELEGKVAALAGGQYQRLV